MERLSAVKGDRVQIAVDVGGGVREFEITATKAGRRVEISTGRGVVEVTEVTRSGQAVRSARFMASRVIALVEYPALEGADDESPPRRTPRETQPSLGLDEEG
jgi:hypothetical protein